jgi:5-(carboxyamino)imidazole ribonucleotide synthase
MKNRLGIIGGGQLGRMLTIEAKKLGFHVTVIDPTPSSPAAQVADTQIIAGYSDPKATKKLLTECDYVTLEIEHIDTKTLKNISTSKMNPSPQTIEIIKDKFSQKEYLTNHSIPTAEFLEIKSEKDIYGAGEVFGYPLVLKAKKDAFDGRGNALIQNKNHVKDAMKKLENRELYVEKFVPFKMELAVVLARGKSGEIKMYPVVETVHKNNICNIVKAPAKINAKTKLRAQQLAKDVMSHLKGNGVFAIEMFLTKNNTILINEIAPRVHNSGHFTIEGCSTSQFEQHIRAVTNLPLGNTEMLVARAVMINILGDRKGEARVKGMEKALALPNVHVHIYGKSETKPERKMGHITVTGKITDNVLKIAQKARKYITI